MMSLLGCLGKKAKKSEGVIKITVHWKKKNSNNNNKYKLSLPGFFSVFYGETDISKLNYNKNHTASDMSV